MTEHDQTAFERQLKAMRKKAQEAGRYFGRAGGLKRAQTQSPAELSEQGHKASAAAWTPEVRAKRKAKRGTNAQRV